MEENKSGNQQTEFQVLLEEHPELEDMMLKYINGNDFKSLYNQYFWKPLNNCINACVKNMGKSYVYSVTSSLLEQFGFKDFRSYAEYMVINSIFDDSKQKCQNEDLDLYVILDGLFTKALSTNEFKEYIITILSSNAKNIGMGYINLLVEYLQHQPPRYIQDIPDDDYERS